MPFIVEALETSTEGNELIVRGRVITGAYFGPELANLRSPTGEELATCIHSHSIERPEGWPIIPEHRTTVLIFSIPHPPIGFKVATIVGVGTIAPTKERIDVSDALEDPTFWAIQLGSWCNSEEVEEPGQQWLGVDPSGANNWYMERIQRPIDRGVSLYMRIPLASSQYVEFEIAGGVEYQERIWIGQESASQRTLLGYHSGHFSLPALRLEELSYLAERTEHAAVNLLWLSATYLETGSDALQLATRLVSGVPGLVSGKENAVANAIVEGLTVRDVTWHEDGTLGWINNSNHSQRNPASRLSGLKEADFAYIKKFFA
jgi:hypothetical protein